MTLSAPGGHVLDEGIGSVEKIEEVSPHGLFPLLRVVSEDGDSVPVLLVITNQL